MYVQTRKTAGSLDDSTPIKPDEELFAAAMAGGPEAFASIVERYQDAVFGVALARIGNFHAAEDIAQDVFVAAFERLATLKNPARLGAWLRSVAIHRSIDFLRRRREIAAVDERAMGETDEHGPAARLERRELRAAVLAAIGRLTTAQRETTTLFYINGYSVAEVAAMQEVPVGTVKYRLHDAREKLKKDMIGMVENVLKAEAPKEDLAQRVFELLARDYRDTHEHELFRALRRVGAEGGIDGFGRAFESPISEARAQAVKFITWFDAPDNRRRVADLLKRGMGDPSGGVRCQAMRAALGRFACSDEQKRRQFVPMAVGLLSDPMKYVRQYATWILERHWAADVPLGAAARAMLDEPNRAVRKAKEDLLRAVLAAQAMGAVPATDLGDADQRLAKLREKLQSPHSSVRAGAVSGLLTLPTDGWRKGREIVPLVAGMLTDRARRVRWRAAYELCAWAGDVPIDVVERACRAEAHAGTRRQMEVLLRKATEEQEAATEE